ncbi:ubiquitin carboxyl-terminal hydrolase 20 isoform X3 [Zootermopsis nevadensis]|uniref:ubiquitin carboxyl-terminal hydrolase 20 isoform X3 n=1 Tax=Zootermopsis nevadensis TaxID=136037 RepID=UPI000B8EA633|nr:ubiquitin carboxyl-terminal hydrolase 20 isoform X3 [Zootermopsis nevadensis]
MHVFMGPTVPMNFKNITIRGQRIYSCRVFAYVKGTVISVLLVFINCTESLHVLVRIMAGRGLKCPHVSNISDFDHSDVERAKEVSRCSECDSSGPNLWLCLHHGCYKIGCGEAHNDHSTLHNRSCHNHYIQLNLSTNRLWCYQCENEVFLEHDISHSRSNSCVMSPMSTHCSPKTFGAAGECGDSSDSEDSCDGSGKPRGLTGLQNIGNTCYMNSALQALSNTPPLTQFFLDCGASLVAASCGSEKKPGLSKSYHRLVQEMWHRRRPGYVVPSGILYGIRNKVHPMFRGYQQHDTQEFLRCFMDQLHEELKEPLPESAVSSVSAAATSSDNNSQSMGGKSLGSGSLEEISDEDEDQDDGEDGTGGGGGVSSQSEGEYETCDSGVSERSSLSDEGEHDGSSGSRSASKRKLSRSPSPPPERLRSKLTAAGSKNSGSVPSSQALTSVGTSGGGPNTANSSPVSVPGSPQRAMSRGKKTPVKHRSIISDVFDGKLLSSVQCLTCDRISTRVETFQDLSLPIPSRDHIHMLHQGTLTPQQKGGLSACSDVYSGDQGWVTWLWEWVRSWFWGPTVSLHDCLAAFFSADELKGDNMYSCEKCNKLRNGVKYSKVLELPEVLCIHLKRFRHELMFSAKISSYVAFPLEGLDMRPYLHKDCVSQVTSYNLVSVICHHGTAGGGHYTCYSLNCISEQWFEFDDQYVTQVPPETVQNCEAYVLFYKKCGAAAAKLRHRAVELMELSHHEPSLMQFYVSKQWVNKFNTFAEPGPIDNSDFLCIHGGVHPAREPYVNQLCTILSQAVWEYLYDTFGGGPACNRLYACPTCQQEQEALAHRVKHELDVFMQLNKEFQQAEDSPVVIYAIAMNWFRQWQSFVRGKEPEPPGQIDNSSICTVNKNGQVILKMGSDYAQLSEELWSFFHRVYGGGPEVVLRPPCQRTGTGSSVGCNNSGSTLQPPPVSRTAPAAPESPLGMANAHKACSIENIATSHVGASGMSGGFGTVFHPAGRAQSVSSDNITVRMAALSASGNKPSENTDSKGQETGKEVNQTHSMHLYLLYLGLITMKGRGGLLQ